MSDVIPQQQPEIITLTYFSCNKDTVILFCIIMVLLIIALLIIKLFAYSNIYKELGICHPVYFFWGEQTCKKEIGEKVKKIIKEQQRNNSKDGFSSVEPELFYDIRNLYKDCEFFIKKNSLAMTKFIHSIQEYIFQFIERNIIHTLLHEFKNVVILVGEK